MDVARGGRGQLDQLLWIREEEEEEESSRMLGRRGEYSDSEREGGVSSPLGEAVVRSMGVGVCCRREDTVSRKETDR